VEVRRAALKEEQMAAAAGDGGSRGGAGPWASASAPVAGERVAEVAGGEGSEDATSRGVSIFSRGKDSAPVHTFWNL